MKKLGKPLCSSGRAAACLALMFSAQSHAGLISGFESGFSGWEYMGDVSIQSVAVGIAPTQGEHMAFISTMCDRDNPPIQGGGCDTSVNEHPYSGVSSPRAAYARNFLGLPPLGSDFFEAMPDPCPGEGSCAFGSAGEGGAMKIRFYAPQAGLLSFDWNRLGADSDSAYLSLWSDDPQASDRINDWIYAAGTFEGSFTQGGVDLCSRYYDVAPNPNCAYLNTQTGWSTKTVNVSQAGWYWIGFGVGEVAEGTTPTVLALDNLKFQVPEPSTLALLGIGIAAIGCGRRKRAANQGWL